MISKRVSILNPSDLFIHVTTSVKKFRSLFFFPNKKTPSQSVLKSRSKLADNVA